MSVKKPDSPEWFTIKEAAKYLSIGEPTLYRWMRDGRITYRKVGDSTRFLKEDLETFVQVFHSKRDAEKARQICPVCHHEELVVGTFRSTGLNYFRPNKSKFWSIHDANIKTTAIMCRRCGAVTNFGDIKKLQKLVSQVETEENSPEPNSGKTQNRDE